MEEPYHERDRSTSMALPQVSKASRPATQPSSRKVGVVVIGRNEGARLQSSIEAIPDDVDRVVYVDSGSTDDSVAIARGLGADVVLLDRSSPYTAARARNAGFERVMQESPQVEYVQFIDGDTSLDASWISMASIFMGESPEVAAVFGRLSEKSPRRSIYNQVCDIEWGMNDPGECKAFLGIVMIRAGAFAQVGGYDPNVIAAEDDELSIRIRETGATIVHLDAQMAFHDAEIVSFRQWWIRAKRTGYAFAQVNAMHGGPPEFYFRRNVRRTIVWGMFLPLAVLGVAAASPGLALTSLVVLYGARTIRTTLQCRRKGWSDKAAISWGMLCTMASFPHLVGWIRYWHDTFRGRYRVIIEYK